MSLRRVFVVVIAVTCACKPHDDGSAPSLTPPPPPASTSAAPPPATASAATPAASASSSSASSADSGAPAEPVGPTAETVYAKMKSVGLKIVDERDVAATPFGAKRCVGARAVSAAGATLVRMLTCEFATEDAASSTGEVGSKTYAAWKAAVPNVELMQSAVHRGTIFGLGKEKKSSESDDAFSKAWAAFSFVR